MITWLHSAELVGRGDERQLLQEALDDARAGRGSLVLVSGEAGIGKSALVDDLKQIAGQQGFCVLWGGCYDLTTTPPYGPWLEALGRYRPSDDGLQLPRWAVDSARIEHLGGRSELFRDFQQIFSDITSRHPLVIVLEDLHWSDQGSLDVLRFLGRQADEIGMLIVATYRDDELSRGHPLFRSLPYLSRESDALRLELAPLAPAAIRQLTAPLELSPGDTDRLATYLHQRAEGNPLFTLELLRALEAAQILRRTDDRFELGVVEGAQVPALVSQLIERRLSMVPVETRELIEVAAIIGDEIDIGLWAQVAGWDEAALDEPIRRAFAATILKETPDGRGLQFTHALVREALYEGVVLSRRRALHRQIAERLVDAPARDPDAIAHHFERADDERALGWLVAGGVRARMAIDYLSAADRFERAATIMAKDSARARERGWLLQLTGELERYAGGGRSAKHHEEAYRLGLAAGDELLTATALGRRGSQHNLDGEFRIGMQKIEEAAAMLDRLIEAGCERDPNRAARSVVRSLLPADEVAPSRVSTLATADSRHLRAIWMPAVGRYREAVVRGEAMARDLDDRLGDAFSGQLGLADAHSALGQPEIAARESALVRRHALAGEEYLGLHTMTLIDLWQIALPYRADRPEERRQLLAVEREGRKRATDLGSDPARHTGCEALLTYFDGDWMAARGLADAGLRSSLVVDIDVGATITGIVAREQGEPELAWEQIRRYLPDGPANRPGGSYFIFANRLQRLAADLSMDAGDMITARAWLEANDRWLEWSEALLGQVEGQLGWARFHLLEGDDGRARQHAERALELGIEPRQPLGLIAAHRFIGLLDIQRQDYAGAQSHLETSLQLASVCSVPFEQAMTMLEMAELHVVSGRSDLAESSLERVREICGPIQAALALARADEIASRLNPPTVNYPDGLTPREAEVLYLIAAGRSNREMADDLYLSIRTIERHVANIYRKIDVHNRAEAARYAIEQGLTVVPTT